MTPKVSFVIPTWNGDTYLAETLESIRKQTMKEIEIIVVDDYSPDFTDVLMDWYCKQDDRIHYFKLDTNSGSAVVPRNFGNEKAQAELICVSDHDDLSMKWRAAYSYHYMMKHPEIDCLTSAYWECNVDGQPVKKYMPPDMSREVFTSGNYVWMHSSACYRKKDILEIPYRNVDRATDDYVFLEDWTNKGKTFKTVKPVLANCRRTPWSQMQTRRAIQGAQPSYML